MLFWKKRVGKTFLLIVTQCWYTVVMEISTGLFTASAASLDFFSELYSPMLLQLNTFTLWIIVLGIIILSGVISVLNRPLAASTILGFYPAVVLYQAIPQAWLSNTIVSSFFGKLIVFVLVYIFVVVLIQNVLNDYFARHIQTSFIEGLFLGIALAILFLTVIFHLIPAGELLNSTSFLDAVFQPQEYIFLHYLLPLILFFMALNI